MSTAGSAVGHGTVGTVPRGVSPPTDAAVVQRLSGGIASAAWKALAAAEADLASAERRAAAWGDVSAIRRVLGFLRRREDERVLGDSARRHAEAFLAFRSIVVAARAHPDYPRRPIVPAPRMAPRSVPRTGTRRPVEPDAVEPGRSPPIPRSSVGLISGRPRDRLPNETVAVPAMDAPPLDASSAGLVDAETPAFSPTIPPLGSVVSGLFAPRSAEGGIRPHPRTRAPERVYLAIPPEDRDAAVALGATLGKRGGVHVDAGRDLSPFERWLPFYARPSIVPLSVDLIPETNWGGSLANLLTATSWKAVRGPVIARTGDICLVCGFAGNGSSVDCHEIWQYHAPRQGDVGVQRLTGMIPVCGECHGMFHLGRARADDRLDEVLDRLAWANRWSRAEVERYYDYVGSRYRARNRLRWELDLSILGAAEPLVVRGGAKGVEIREDGDLRFVHRHGEGSTRFLGVRFGHPGGPVRDASAEVDYSLYRRDV